MSKLSDIKQRAARIAQRRSDGEQLGPDRGTMDQEEARIERARAEARQEAERERIRQRTEEAREEERDRVLNDGGGGGIVSSVVETIETAADAVDDGDDQRLDDLSQAFGSDFDGDGETFAEEMGLQSAARADAEDDALQGLSEQVGQNTNRIGSLEGRGMGGEPRGRERSGGSGFGGGGGIGNDIDPADFGFGGGDGGDIDPADFGFGGSDDGGGVFGGDR